MCLDHRCPAFMCLDHRCPAFMCLDHRYPAGGAGQAVSAGRRQGRAAER